RYGVNVSSNHALPAYLSAVASIEAFISESLLSHLTLVICKDSPLCELGVEWIEDDLSLSNRLLVSTKLLFGWTLTKGKQPYQDFDMLVSVRNDIVHYKNDAKQPFYMA